MYRNLLKCVCLAYTVNISDKVPYGLVKSRQSFDKELVGNNETEVFHETLSHLFECVMIWRLFKLR